MMPKGRKELYSLELPGCISNMQTIGSLYYYLCFPLYYCLYFPLLSFPTLSYTQSAVSLHVAVKLCPIAHLPTNWFPTQTVHNPLDLLIQLFLGSG